MHSVQLIHTLDIKNLDIKCLIALWIFIIQDLHGKVSLHLSHLKHQLLGSNLDIIPRACGSRAIHRLISDRSLLSDRALAMNSQCYFSWLFCIYFALCKIQAKCISFKYH